MIRSPWCLVAAAALVAGGLSATPAAASGPHPRPPARDFTSFPAMPADSLVDQYGVNVHLGFLDTAYADHDSVATALKDLGVRHVRDSLVIGNTGPKQYSAIAGVAQDAGVRFDLILGRPDGTPTASDYVGAVASHLPSGTVESLEGVNEWDLKGPQAPAGSGDTPPWIAQMKDWQHQLYTAAKANPATAGLPVLSPALAFATNYPAAGDMSADEDVANLHVYPGGYQPLNLLPQASAYLHAAINNANPVVVTETGYHNATMSSSAPVPESVAGVYAPRLLLDHARRGEQRVYSYELVDEKSDPSMTDPERDYGLLHTDFSPKPAYTALKTLLALVDDPGPAFTTTPLSASASGMPSDGHSLLYQKRDGQYVLLLWRDVDIFDPVAQQAESVTPANVTLNLAALSSLSVYHPSVSAAAASTTTATSVTVPLDGQVTAITIAPPPPPAPQSVRARPGVRRASVTWTEPAAADPVTGFEVSVSPGGATHVVGATVRAFTATSLDPRRRYTFTVRALSATGTSGGTTSGAVPAALSPTAPPGVTARARPGKVIVVWRAAGGQGLSVTGYRVSAAGHTVLVGGGSRRAVLTGLAAGRRLRVRVVARNAIGWGGASVSGYVTVLAG